MVAVNKREIIRDALERNSGHVARTARALGLQATYLHRLIRNLGLRDQSTHDEPTT
jgi:transcriptional regulator with GAF, ATPase, and Fis domain